MPNNVSVAELKAKAKELRLNIVQTTFNATSGHVGGSMSSADMLIALYFKYLNVDPKNPDWDERDRFVMSKGHCALAYVPCLAMRGYLDLNEVMRNFNKTESAYGMHPDSKKIRGCDASTGSLGHGLPMAVGMALGLRLKKIDSKVVVMTGDGECQEGSNWEAAMSAAHFGLKNLIWIIDRNHFEIDGNTEDVMSLEPLDKKVSAQVQRQQDGRSGQDPRRGLGDGRSRLHHFRHRQGLWRQAVRRQGDQPLLLLRRRRERSEEVH